MKKKRSAKTPRLGQHFLRGTWAARKLVEAAGIRAGDTVLEIGPGTGALTRELLATGARVIAVEKDEHLVEKLRNTFAEEIRRNQLTVIADDIRSFDPASYRLQATSYCLAANIPYYITGEILRQFLTMRAQPNTMALLVQKEVAVRIVARDGKESILSISVKAYGDPKVVAKVSRGNFSPPPKVDSAIIVIENISRDFFRDMDEETFFKLVRAGFSSKRKLLRRNLDKFGFTKSTFETCGIGEKARAEDAPLEKWKCLARNLPAR